MKPSDWQQVWDKHGAKADGYFAQIEPELDQIIRKKSNSVIDAVRRNLILELWATAILGILGVLYLDAFSRAWWFWMIAILVVLLGSSLMYWRVIRRFQLIETQSVKGALLRKIDILNSFVRRLKLYAYLILPAAMISSFCFSMYQHGRATTISEMLMALLQSSWLLIPGMLVFLWFCGKYIHWLYGRYLKDLRGLLGVWRNEVTIKF